MSSIRIPKTATAAEILKCLNKWAILDDRDYFSSQAEFVEAENERRMLWEVLTALRGPDGKESYEKGESLKARFTEPIRAVVSELANRCGGFTDDELNPETLHKIIEFGAPIRYSPDDHFVRHAFRAAKSLHRMIMRGELKSGPQS